MMTQRFAEEKSICSLMQQMLGEGVPSRGWCLSLNFRS
jgi:hypothetical protein